MSDKNYIPISCDLHSQLELAIMHQRKISIKIESNTTEYKITPLDIFIKSKSEYLKYLQDGHQDTDIIRLDKIKQIID